MTDINQASFKEKTNFTLPKGAKIIKKDISISVREIENGFIISKSYDLKYTEGKESKYEYFTKEWFSKENPMGDFIKDTEKELADKF